MLNTQQNCVTAPQVGQTYVNDKGECVTVKEIASPKSIYEDIVKYNIVTFDNGVKAFYNYNLKKFTDFWSMPLNIKPCV